MSQGAWLLLSCSMDQNSNLRICLALNIQLEHGPCSIRTIHPEGFDMFGSGPTCAFCSRICWEKKSVKSFYLEDCLYGCFSKLKTYSFIQGRGTVLVLTVLGEGFSVRPRIVIKMKKRPQPQELKGTAVIIVPVGRTWPSFRRLKERLKVKDKKPAKMTFTKPVTPLCLSSSWCSPASNWAVS